MASSPITIVTLLTLANCDKTYECITVFRDNDRRDAHYNSVNKKVYNNCMYIRKNGFVDLPILFDEAYTYNYCLYNNNEGKGVEYAFIDRIEFINFGVTRFHLKYDVVANNNQALVGFQNHIEYEQRLLYGVNPARMVDIQVEPSVLTITNLTTNYGYAMYITFAEAIDSWSELENKDNVFSNGLSAFVLLTEDGVPFLLRDDIIPDVIAYNEAWLHNWISSGRVASISVFCIPLGSYLENVFDFVTLNITGTFFYGYKLRYNMGVDMRGSDIGINPSYTDVHTYNFPINNFDKRLLNSNLTSFKIKSGTSEVDIDLSTIINDDVVTINDSVYISCANADVYITHKLTINGKLYILTDSSVKLSIFTDSESKFMAYNSTYYEKLMLDNVNSILNFSGKGEIPVISGVKNALVRTGQAYLDLEAIDKQPDSNTIGGSLQQFVDNRPGLLTVRLYTPQPEEISRISHYYDEYGIRVYEHTTLDIMPYTKYNYIKGKLHPNIIPNSEDKEELKEIFMRGVKIYCYDTDTLMYGSVPTESQNVDG